MVRPEDNRTIPLPLPSVTEKRGRGRPRKESALSNAQRQAAFRARHKGQAKSVTITENVAVGADGYDDLVLENDRLREELAATRAENSRIEGELYALRQAFRRPVGHKWSYRQITDQAETRIRKFAEAANSDPDKRLGCQGWAYGVWVLWDEVTYGCRQDGDAERVRGLFESLVTK